MKCQDARYTLSLFVDGKLALTEWAIIQGHLLECADCRKELDRVRRVAGVRARVNQHRAIAMTAAAMAVVLGVAAVGGVSIYRGSFPDLPSWGPPPPPRTAAPTAPAPEPAAPATVPTPSARPSPPPPARAKGTAQATPWGTAPPASEPAARATRPAVTAEPPTEDRMPTTQARPPAVVNAPPDAEAMPTQASSRTRP
jgi:hypothetical protein